MAKRKKKDKPEADPKDDPTISYALRESPTRTLADAWKELPKTEAATDAYVQELLKRPDFIWGGMTPTVLRLIARIQKDAKTPRIVSPLD